MSSRRVLVTLSLVLSALLVSGPAAAQTTSFRDVGSDVHGTSITALAGEGIVEGCEDGAFCPDRGLTRGQVASILVRALDLTATEDAPDFGDTRGSAHRDAIAALAEENITDGCEPDRFCPNEYVSRGQLATLLARALGVPAASGTYFADASGTHEAGINALADAGIAAGCDLIHFCPSDRLSRAQGATFIARGLDLVDRAQLAPYADRRAQWEQEQASAPGQQAADTALAQVGKPYQWGGNGPASFDCSGLTRFAWSAAGVDLPRTSADQHRAARSIDRSQLRPGDLVFYHQPVSHVAIYVGDGQVVESPTSGNSVRVSSEGLTRSGIVGYGRPG